MKTTQKRFRLFKIYLSSSEDETELPKTINLDRKSTRETLSNLGRQTKRPSRDKEHEWIYMAASQKRNNKTKMEN